MECMVTHWGLEKQEALAMVDPWINWSVSYLLSQVPVPLADQRRRFLAMKWMITECREHKHRRILMPEKLSHELLQAFHNQGPVIKRKQEMHKMAEANRALAHYRWW